MNVKKLRQYFGSIAVAAEKIGVTRQAIHYWEREKGGAIPFEKQLLIEHKTKGELKAKE